MNIVVVEDHHDLRDLLVDHLKEAGFSAAGVTCGEELDDFMSGAVVRLLILDVNLPGENGLDIARRVRSAQPDINIIMLTAKTEETDRIKGYESGADLYLSKPVSAQELTAAVRAVQRRLNVAQSARAELTLDTARMTLSTERGETHLSKADTQLLKGLILAPDMLLPYWRLFEITERAQTEQAKGQLELQVFRLRKKLAEIGIPETVIKSVRGEGYQLTRFIRIEG